MMKKTPAAAIAALGLGVVLAAAACSSGGGSGGGSSSNSPVTLTFWTNAVPGPGLTYFQNAVKTYHSLHPHVTIKIQSIRSHLEGDTIGYIRITSFNEQTDVGLNNAMKNLKQQAGNKLAGVVLDLRNNPGGLLDQAVAVSDAFLDKGEIVSTRGRRSEDAQRYNARPGDIASGLPVAVLINGGSASASEIVAGALQDHHRAILLGTKSFGKGSVQTIIPLPGHGAMRLTTARYYTPSGRSIQAKGIDPDIVVEAAKIEKEKGEKAATATDLKKEDSGDGPPEQTSVDPSIMGTPADYQLARAVDMLRGIAMFNGRVVN